MISCSEHSSTQAVMPTAEEVCMQEPNFSTAIERDKEDKPPGRRGVQMLGSDSEHSSTHMHYLSNPAAQYV
jgi:hypothetical protein